MKLYNYDSTNRGNVINRYYQLCLLFKSQTTEKWRKWLCQLSVIHANWHAKRMCAHPMVPILLFQAPILGSIQPMRDRHHTANRCYPTIWKYIFQILPRGQLSLRSIFFTFDEITGCKRSKCPRILLNKHRDSIIKRLYAQIEVSSWTKYGKDPWYIVGRIAVMSCDPRHRASRIHQISKCYKILDNENRDHMNKWVHALTH